MGKKGTRDRQASMWVATADLPKSAGHPFYARLNRVLDDAGFDTFVEAQCAPFYADGIGRPSLAPGRDVRLLLLGYFEGLDSERAIAWRAADSLSIRQFLDFALHEAPPDHSTLSRTRRLIDVETHQAVFTWVLQRLADAHLVEGHTIGIDATTLEANAAMRSIVRRDTGDAYEAWLTRLAEASGIATPTRAELARFDRKRKKKGSNEDWTNPHDPDAKITKMKDGRTHLAHTAEHAVDLETGAIVGVTVQDADAGDTTTMVETLIEAADQLAAVDGASGVAEVVGDKGYHSNETMVGCADLGVRSYVSEPDRGRRKWKGKAAAKKAVYANRRRIRGHRGQRLLRQRGELLERPNAHLYETGRMRRVHLRGHANILTRLLVHVCGANLGLLMRQLTGVGTPRSLQGRAAALLGALINLLGGLCERLKRSWAPEAPDAPDSSWGRPRQVNTNTRSSIYEEPLLPRAARRYCRSRRRRGAGLVSGEQDLAPLRDGVRCQLANVSDGRPIGGCCISATLRDYGRLGLFAMSQSTPAGGQHVLAEDWMALSTMPSPSHDGYGYQWWLREDGSYSAMGFLGQLIHVNPAEDLVIVTHSSWDGSDSNNYNLHQSVFISAMTAALKR